MTDTSPDRYAVIGNPIEHSKSPEIHRLFAQQTDQNIRYEKRLAALDGFRQAVLTFRNEGGRGVNVTVPFKRQAYELADEHSERALAAGAANTLVFTRTGEVYADNTDGAGLVLDITENLKLSLCDQRVLILGAGGAVRGVLGPILEERPASVVLANRTVAKAVELARDFSRDGEVSAAAFHELGRHPFDWIINGTAASLHGELPPLPDALIGPDTVVYDMMYSPDGTTVFTAWAQRLGCRQAFDGLGMLVGQAAESFYLWRGVRPKIKPVVAALRRCSA